MMPESCAHGEMVALEAPAKAQVQAVEKQYNSICPGR
jgi:hypothetical protein